jgi:rhamnosyl/mannosyltransferase
VPFGLEVERYRRVRENPPRIEPLTTTRRPTFLFVGRLVGYKGVDVLLQALPGLDANIVIVGNGPLRHSLEAMTRDLGIADRVRFLGEVSSDELLECYHACDAFVLPSITRQEAFGMVQLEAMLHGRPVISTELGTGVSWVNQHERTGLIVRPGDVAELRRALQRLIDDPGLRHELGAAARTRVLSHFTAEKMCSATFTLYQEVSGRASLSTRAEPAAVA